MQDKQVIGITGASGTGKSTFTSLLAKKYINCKIIDVDKIGHASLLDSSVIEILSKTFGIDILDESGNVIRKNLGALVFDNEPNMDILIKTTWPFMKKEIEKIITTHPGTIIIDWIRLPITEIWDKCNTKILITADKEKRKAQIMKRDCISEEYFEQRDKSCIEYSSYEFDYIIQNDYTNYEMHAGVNKVFRDLSMIR
jgi:dephospho-CoA kinase